MRCAHYDMDQELLQTVYGAVIIAKLMYASSAWWGSPPQQTGNAWSLSSVVLDVPGYITLTGRQLLSLLRMQMTHYLVQLPVLPIIFSMSFYPNIPIIHITLDQGPIVSNSLPSMMIVILLTECFLDRPTRYLCDC